MEAGTLTFTKISLIDAQKTFNPPFCPNRSCPFHIPSDERFYVKNGFLKTEKPPYKNQRYRCRHCRKQFCYTYFSLDFRKRRTNLFKEVFIDKVNGMTNNSIARKLNISEGSVRLRLSELKRQAILRKKELERKLVIKEPVVYDGFESFHYGQFDPCYVNTAIGKSSLYTYEMNYSPLNRKGRMTPWQKKKNAEIVSKFGAYPRNSIRKQSTYTFEKLLSFAKGRSLILHTDDHKSYATSLKKDLKTENITHYVTSSKKRRDTKNPLFAVNHLHLYYRHFTAPHRRETIAFNKNEAGLMNVLTLKTINKNFLMPQILNKARGNKKRNERSPAMDLGLTEKIMSFEEFFDHRRSPHQFEMDEVEKELFYDTWKYARRKVRAYVG